MYGIAFNVDVTMRFVPLNPPSPAPASIHRKMRTKLFAPYYGTIRRFTNWSNLSPKVA